MHHVHAWCMAGALSAVLAHNSWGDLNLREANRQTCIGEGRVILHREKDGASNGQ